MTKSYSMKEAVGVGKEVISKIIEHLKKLPCTIDAVSVENDPYYQKKDIDILWKCRDEKGELEGKIEVKTDRYHRTGNYFFETISNKSRNTPGCFIYTEADYIFYYFTEIEEVHILPIPEVRDWFLEIKETFEERETSTPVGNEHYITVGRLVPRKTVTEHFNIQILKLGNKLENNYVINYLHKTKK
jgi:hypothetical protein